MAYGIVTYAVISHLKLERRSVPLSPSSMLGRQKSDIWLQDVNIETGGGREGGKNVSRNGVACVAGVYCVGGGEGFDDALSSPTRTKRLVY
jgi:hypothetical protein